MDEAEESENGGWRWWHISLWTFPRSHEYHNMTLGSVHGPVECSFHAVPPFYFLSQLCGHEHERRTAWWSCLIRSEPAMSQLLHQLFLNVVLVLLHHSYFENLLPWETCLWLAVDSSCRRLLPRHQFHNIWLEICSLRSGEMSGPVRGWRVESSPHAAHISTAAVLHLRMSSYINPLWNGCVR